MKTPAGFPFSAFLISAIFIVNVATSQIEITTLQTITPTDMVEKIVGEGVQYSNVEYQGSNIASGTFTNGSTTNLGLENGIFLTSGSGYLIPGPSVGCSSGTSNGLNGHPLLNSITTSTTYDASVLEFDFVPETDTIRFKYVFGSDQYSEWVSSTFNDVFGAFITGPDPAGGYFTDFNIATVPGTLNSSITINNVNNGNAPCGTIPSGPCTNCQFYSDNTNGLTLEYDGLTTVLIAWVIVVPCETYHLKLAIADAGDHIIDSGVFIEQNSFKRPQIDVEADPFPQGVSDDLIEGCVEADLIFRLSSSAYAPVTVCFDIEGTAINGIDYEWIDNCISFEEGQDSVAIHMIPIKDDVIEGEETIVLIIENDLGCNVHYDTVEFTILDYIDMVTQTTPNTIICQGQTVDLSVTAINGFPPYNYEWEGFSIYNDTLTVSPDTSTMYYVNVYDLCQDSVSDSIQVTVFPVCELESFYFEKSYNPGLPFDVYGEITGDSVFVAFPAGTNLNALIPSYTFINDDCSDTVGTINDFTNPVVYEFVAPGGCSSHWTVVADIETNLTQNAADDISIYPNPAKDQIMIYNANGWKFTMLNTVGKTVLEGSISNQNQSINISDLKSGVYFMKLQKEDKVFVKQLVIKR